MRTLEGKLNRVYSMVIATSLLVTVAVYAVLSTGNERQAVAEAQSSLKGLLDGQLPFIIQEFVNDRFYAAVMRGKNISEEHRAEGLQVGLYRPDGSAIFESPELARLREENHRQRVFIEKDIAFAGDRIGKVVFARELDLAGQKALHSSLLMALAIIFAFALFLFTVTRITLVNSVVVPIQRISEAIPHLGRFLDGKDERLRIPASVGSVELDRVLRALSEMGEQLRGALREKREADLKAERQAASSTMARQVAHDIRSPLAAIDAIEQDLANIPEESRVLLRSAVGRIRDIANQLLEKHRDAGRAVTPSLGAGESSSVELIPSLLDDLISEKRLQFRSRLGIEIISELGACTYGLFARVQPIELKRALSNLIDNAVEALGPSGRVIVKLGSAERSRVQIIVADSGAGIPEDVLKRLGLPGQTTGKPNGTGLGLFHARATIERCGGELAITSRLGQGTEVTLSMPRAETPDWFVPELRLGADETLVVLDDDSSIHHVWTSRLEALKVPIVHFSCAGDLDRWLRDGASANLERLRFLLDYELLGEDMTGLDLIEQNAIAARSVLVTSRYEERSIRERCRRLGVPLIPKGMAGFVPIRVRPPRERPDAVLIDDDRLVHLSWTLAARAAGRELRPFFSGEDFLLQTDRFDRATPIFVDAQLADGVRGEELSRRISEAGFENVSLATGRSRSEFPPMPWLRDVVGKEPPFEAAPSAYSPD